MPLSQPFAGFSEGRGPDDGPEYSPDGEWVYFNTERFTEAPGHAQIARIRPDGTELEQLTRDERVSWFPHIDPTGTRAVYLGFPPGTEGHPADLPVQLRVVDDISQTDAWTRARRGRAVRWPGDHQRQQLVARWHPLRLRGLPDRARRLRRGGGRVPIRVRGADVVAALTLSGLSSEEDHALAVEAIRATLTR